METFSGYHMKICFINHCSPVKQKKNLITDEAICLASFLCMETMKQGVFPPSETKRHIHTGASTRTGRSLRGNVLLRQRGRGNTHPACKAASYLQCTFNADWKAQRLSHHLCKSPWCEMNQHVQQPPGAFDVCLPPAPEGRTLLCCQY